MASSKNNPATTTPYTVDHNVRIGHVHLKVADLQRALRFYSGVLELEMTQRYGDGAVFLSAGGYHHHIALNTVGKPWRFPTTPRHNGALPHRHSLPDSSCACGCRAEGVGC